MGSRVEDPGCLLPDFCALRIGSVVNLQITSLRALALSGQFGLLWVWFHSSGGLRRRLSRSSDVPAESA